MDFGYDRIERLSAELAAANARADKAEAQATRSWLYHRIADQSDLFRQWSAVTTKLHTATAASCRVRVALVDARDAIHRECRDGHGTDCKSATEALDATPEQSLIEIQVACMDAMAAKFSQPGSLFPLIATAARLEAERYRSGE